MIKNNISRVIFFTLFLALFAYCLMFYPYQNAVPGHISSIEISTPEENKYHNDVLHPCIRSKDTLYYLVFSPWYKYNDSIENPILYKFSDIHLTGGGSIIADTQRTGYNSDPNVYAGNDSIWVFWREYGTPLCDSLRIKTAVVGISTIDCDTFSSKRVFLTSNEEGEEKNICPILIKRDSSYYFYCTWYNTDRKDRHNWGISIWKGRDLSHPDFHLIDSIRIKPPLIADKLKQIKIFGHLFFIPCPHIFDLWHFDLAEYDGALYMIACEEMGDVIMIGKSTDWRKFRFKHNPIVNAHYMENHVDYRQKYYKPTMYFQNDSCHIFWTTNSKNDQFHNILQNTTLPISKID